MSVQTPRSLDQQTALLQRIWLDCFRGVLSQVAGFAVTAEPEGTDERAVSESAGDKAEVWALFATGKALHGEIAILSTEAGAVQLAQLLMSETQDSTAPFDQAHREAYEELLRLVVGQVTTKLKNDAGREVEIKLSGKDAPVWENATRAGIVIGGEKLAPIPLFLIVSTELAESFRATQEKSAPRASNQPEAPILQSEPQSEASTAQNSNLELLLDVTLDATICFGQKQMLLRDILELHPGAAVVLDRQVEEPVDLLVGGRMVARGEVVIVNGNYGLRITEIVSPQHRIASLIK